MPTVKLISSNGITFEVDMEIAKQLQKLNTMIDDDVDNKCDEFHYELSGVDAETLEKVY